MNSIGRPLIAVGLLITLAACSHGSKSGRMSLSVDDSKYMVFCANNKLEVEQRTLEQEKSARGSNVCQMAESTISRTLSPTPSIMAAKGRIADVIRCVSAIIPTIRCYHAMAG